MERKSGSMGKRIKVLSIVLGIGVLYLVWVKLTGLAIPCLFREITGWLCPGCGITTLFVCLSRLDFHGAFQANPFLLVTAPILAAEIIYYNYMQIKEKPLPKWNQRALLVYIGALCLFGVWRNLCF